MVIDTSALVAMLSDEPDAGQFEADLWLHRAAVEQVAVDTDQADTARVAYRRYGKGRHRAGLNYGDCFSYALTRVSGQALLCKGDAFTHTDIDTVRLPDSSHG